MRVKATRGRWVLGVMLILALVAGACGSGDDQPAATTEAAPTTTAAAAPATTAAADDMDTMDDTEAPATTAAAPATTAAEPAPAPDDGSRTLRIAISDDVETLDPTFGQATLTNLTLKNIYMQPVQYLPGPSAGRFSYADTTSFEGQSVESWEFSDGGETITFKMRQGLTFPESGNPVTVDDFIWTIERALGTAAGPAWVWGNVGVTSLDQVERVDDETIRITGARPSAIVLPLLRDQTLGLLDSETVSAQATEDDPWSLEWLGQNYAGNGRYVIDNWERGSRVVLKANPTWPDEPFFTTVEMLVVPESSNRLALLQNGDVDIALDLSAQELDRAEGLSGVDVLSVPDRAAFNVLLNTQQPPFDDLNVRLALTYASPYNAIVDGVLRGRAVPSQGPMSVNSRFFDLYGLGDLWSYDTDLDRARELLAEAGYADGLQFDMIITEALPYVEAAAANLKAAYSEIGVDMTIVPVSAATMAERLFARDYQAAQRGYLTDFVDDPFYHFFLWWGTDTVINWTGFSDPDVDRVLEETGPIVDDAERREPYREAIGKVIDAAPMLWLANADFSLAVREDIGGYVHHPDQLLWFATLNRSGG